jgi:hypothetical protein
LLKNWQVWESGGKFQEIASQFHEIFLAMAFFAFKNCWKLTIFPTLFFCVEICFAISWNFPCNGVFRVQKLLKIDDFPYFFFFCVEICFAISWNFPCNGVFRVQKLLKIDDFPNFFFFWVKNCLKIDDFPNFFFFLIKNCLKLTSLGIRRFFGLSWFWMR